MTKGLESRLSAKEIFVHITMDQYRHLKKLKIETGMSFSEVVRAALQAHMEKSEN